MSAFTEFILVAIALYLWESTQWLPLRGVALRKKWFGKGWRVLDPRSVMAGKELGLIPLLPLPPDTGIAPCQAPPLLATPDGGLLLETSAGNLIHFKSLEWSDLNEKDHYLAVSSGARTRITSPRCIDVLRRAKNRGATLQAAVAQAWRMALSPTRAAREWRRWRMVSGTLTFCGPLLTVGLFAGLPLAYIHLGIVPMLLLAAWLWVIMIFTACNLWWLGRRVYPAARSALRMDAVLCVLVPFHAMRAREIASIHAMGATHPIGLILSTGDLDNPWLTPFIRKVLFPLPASPEEILHAAALRPLLGKVLGQKGRTLEDYDTPPDRTDDPDSTCYCPRCHASYLKQAESCPDCPGIALVPFKGQG